ncbi:MAG: hypothetical protein IJF61_02565 [Clostridia bacterium]|nr:hypothetical protein [Clostridia bacterium]
MTTLGWILIVLGALINFLAKPVLVKLKKAENDPEQKLLYTVKVIGLCLVIAGAIMIFIAGGNVNVGAIR